MRHFLVTLKTNSVHIYPICDTQIGAPGGADLHGFRKWVKEARADPLARFVGVGDYVDGLSPSNRKNLLAAFVKGDLYDTAREMLNDSAIRQVQHFQKLIGGTEGKWDAVAAGHHFWEWTADGHVYNTDMMIADLVGAPYTPEGESAVITYKFRNGQTFRLWMRHGENGGGSFAGPINQLEKMMRAFTADAYLIGHHHKLVGARAVKLSERPGHPTELLATDSVLVCAGSWMRGYMPGMSTYAEAAMMVPLATGAPVIRARAKKDGLQVRVEI